MSVKGLSRLNNMSIKSKILLLGIISILLTIGVISYSVFNSFVQFTEKVAVTDAQIYYRILQQKLLEERSELKQGTEFIANADLSVNSIVNGDYSVLQNHVMPIAKNKTTDIFFVVDKNGKIIADYNNPSRSGGKFASLDKLLKKAMTNKETITSYEIVLKDDLLKENKELYERAKMQKAHTEGAKKDFRGGEKLNEDALVNIVITAIKNNSGQVVGAVAAGSLMNRNLELVDSVKADNDGIAVTIFQDDLRIATTVVKPDGNRAVGTLLSEKVVDKVLIGGSDFVGRAMVVGNPFWSFYSPVKNSDNQVIGCLFTAMSEKKLMDIIKNNFLSKFIVTIIILIAIVVPIFIVVSGKIVASIHEILKGIEKDTSGHIQIKEVKVFSQDEVGQVAIALNTLTEQVRGFIKKVNESVDEVITESAIVGHAAERTAKGAQNVGIKVGELSKGSQDQATKITLILDDINVMNDVIQKICENAIKVVELAGLACDTAAKSGEQADKAVDKINQIKHSSVETSATVDELGTLSADIGQIVDLIKNIAGQTNLLALNAAIEAARAGEHGKGFAVVADEVKKLADQSAKATDNITSMIKHIQDKTQTVVKSMVESNKEIDDGVVTISSVGGALKEILNVSKDVNGMASEVSSIANELVTNSDKVVKNMETISAVTARVEQGTKEISVITTEQGTTLKEITNNSGSLEKIAENLKKFISVFKI